MPRVPTYDNFQAAPQALPSVRLNAPAVPDVAGQQLQQTGQALQRAGQTMGQEALRMADLANQVRVNDALNQAKEWSLKLTHDKEVGYTALRGEAALNRPEGKTLGDEYAGNLQKRIDELAGTLSNDAQRQMFSQNAGGMVTSLRGNAMDHEAQEFKTYGLSVSEGVQSTALRDIGLNWRNPDAVGNAVKRIEAETYRQAQLLGKSAEWQTAAARKMTSNAHKTALLSALESNDPAFADSYLTKHAEQMEADDILAVRGHITRERDNQVGTAVGDELVGKVAVPRMAPTDTERAFNILIGTESRGRQFGADGKPLTSRAGAVGVAQVMPATGPEAAKLAGLPWDENRYRNDANYNRALGLAYFQKQLQTQGGDLAKAYAAYNAGPGALQTAVRRSRQEGGDWLQYMPAETKAYVAKNMGEYQGGGGRPAKPTFAEIDEQLRADPRLANSPERYKAARAAAQRRFDDMDKAQKQREDEGLNNALQAVVDNGGNFNGLAPAVRAAIPADKVDRVMSLAEKVSKGVEVSTDPNIYYALTQAAVNEPQAFAREDMRAYFDRLSPTDRKHFVDLQARLSKPGEAEQIATTTQQKAAMVQALGLKGETAGVFHQQADKALMAAQNAKGAPLSQDERQKVLDRLVMQGTTPGSWFGTSSVMAFQAAAQAKPFTPEFTDVQKRQATQALQRNGVANPTPQQIEATLRGVYGVKSAPGGATGSF